MFDKLACLPFAGVTGFLPGRERPNEKMAMTCIQTALWYQCYFLVYTIMARSPSRPDSRLRAPSLPRISSCHPRALRQQDPFTYKLEATFKTYYTQGVTPGEVEHLFMHEYNRTGREYYLTFSPDSWISNYESTTIAMNVLNAASIIAWIVLIPLLLEVYALPPYLDRKVELVHVTTTLDQFPDGQCLEDSELLGELSLPLAATAAAATGGVT